MNPGEDDLPDIIDVVREMGRYTEEPEKVPSPPPPTHAQERDRLPSHLKDLTDRARGYVEAASSANTRRAYASDWKHFASWCRRQGLAIIAARSPGRRALHHRAAPPAAAHGDRKPNSVSTIERRLSSLTWNYAQRGQPLDRKDRHIATVMAGIRNKHAAPPRQKEAILPEDLIAMLETLDRGTLRGLRDRAMLLIGFAGGLRRSEIVGLDVGRDQTEDGRGWIEFFPDKGVLVTLAGKNRLARGRDRPRLVRRHLPGRGAADLAEAGADRAWPAVSARHRARQKGRRRAPQRPGGRPARQTHRARRRRPRRSCRRANARKSFAGHSLRAGLASSAEVDERYVQKQLGHASAEMTRKYQRRRDRFRVNLTKASGL